MRTLRRSRLTRRAMKRTAAPKEDFRLGEPAGDGRLTTSVRKLQRAKTKAKSRSRKGRGGPKTGTLPPIADRAWRNPQAVFVLVKQPGGIFGVITGHLNNRFRLPDVERVVQRLVAKKQIKLNRRFKAVDAFSHRAIRFMLRNGAIRQLKRSA